MTFAKKALRRARYEALSVLRGIMLPPLRRRIVASAGSVRLLPTGLRRTLDLDGSLGTPLRVEIGSGPYPSAGFVHVDHDWHSRHLEYRTSMWNLPFDRASVEEILAVHTLEHVHPSQISPTLQEWSRVLRPGGSVEIHVPNAVALLRTFDTGSVTSKWAASAVIYGYGGGPEVASASDIGLLPYRTPTHRTLFDVETLSSVLVAAGFCDIQDLTGTVHDRHSDGWDDVVPGYSLVVRARRRSDGAD